MYFCKECGAIVDDDDKFCRKCGAKLSKDYMTVMSHSLSDEDFNKLRENGFEPSKMEPSKMVTIVDEIKATVAKSGKVVEGYNDDLDRDTLEAITGSQVNADAIYDSFKTYDVPLTDGNIKAAEEALSLSESVQNLSDAAMKYMTENNTEVKSLASINSSLINKSYLELVQTDGITYRSASYYNDNIFFFGV